MVGHHEKPNFVCSMAASRDFRTQVVHGYYRLTPKKGTRNYIGRHDCPCEDTLTRGVFVAYNLG